MENASDGPSLELLGIAAGILLGTLAAGLDAGLAHLGEARLGALGEAAGAGSRAARRAAEDFDLIRSRLLALRVVCVAVAAVLASELLRAVGLPGVPGALVSVGVVAMAYSLLAELTRTGVETRASRWVVPLLRILRPAELLIAPMAAPLAWLGRMVGRRLARPPEDASEEAGRLAVEQAIAESEDEGSMAHDHATLLRSVLDFHNTVAREVMVPRTQTVAIEIGTPVEEVRRLILAEGHSRYPVYRDTVDHVEGVLYVKDFFRALDEGAASEPALLARILRKPVFFAAETQKIGAVLREMQARRLHLAVVVDEYGGTAGVLTLEDILEEIVGEIHDEHDEALEAVRPLGPGRYLVDAGVSVYDLARVVGEALGAEGDYDTLGGMIVTLAGRVPAAGETLEVRGYRLVVRKADARRVVQVEVVCPEPPLEERTAAE